MTHRDVAIVSGCTRLRYDSYVGHQLYARRHGLDCHLELVAFTGVDGYWHKVAALQSHLGDHEWVVWFDDDAFITDLESTFVVDAIGEAEDAEAWLAIAPSCDDELNGAWAAYNTGVFALRNVPEAHELLEFMSTAPMDEIEARWNHRDWGMFTGGDQDALVWFMETRQRLGAIHWVDPLAWNARPWHYRDAAHEPPVCHFPGHPDKTLAISEMARRRGTDASLVRPRVPGRDIGLHRQLPETSRADAALRRASLRGRRAALRARMKIAWIREHRRWS